MPFNRVLTPPCAPSTEPKILPLLLLLSPQATRDLLLKEAARTSSPSFFPPLRPSALSPQATRDLLLKEAARIGDDFLQLEKFVNLNYMVRGLGGRAIARSDSSSARASMIGPA